jgi:archaellum biogenesis protein FlaJ (TadC family)
MTRIVALRASITFVALTVLVGAIISLTSHAAVLTALLLVSGSVAALLIVLPGAPAEFDPIPVRVRRRGAR